MNEIDKRTLTLKRTFNAPRKLVWEAWTQPEHIANWWGPRGMKTQVTKYDFRVGGEWAYIMTSPDGKEFPSDGVFSTIVIFELIESSANFRPITEGVTIVAVFKDAGAQTEFTFKVIHPTEAYCKRQEKIGVMNGWGANFDELDKYLSGVLDFDKLNK